MSTKVASGTTKRGQAASSPVGPAEQPPKGPPLFGIVVLAGLIIVGAGVKSVSSIVGPVFLVLTLVITVHPLRLWLSRRRVPGWLASIVSLLSVYALLVIVLGAVAWSLTRLVNTLPQYSEQFTNLYNQGLQQLAKLGFGAEQLQSTLSNINISTFTGLAQTLLSALSSGLSLFALMLAMVVFLAFDAAGFGDRIQLIRGQRPRVADALTDFGQSVRKYWVVTTLFGFIVAVVDVVGLFIIGVPLAVTWGVLAFVTNYIPNIGFLLGLLPPALIALLNGGVGQAIAVVAVYAVINFVIQTLIQPRFTGDAVGITATVAFLSLIFWAYLLGTLGALLAVPATLLVKSLLVDHAESGRWMGALINSSPTADEVAPVSEKAATAARPNRPAKRTGR